MDVVVGPDAYLDIPNLINSVEQGEKAINVELSKTETYKDVLPTRIGKSISGFVSIMRGCDKFCTYCIVPLYPWPRAQQGSGKYSERNPRFGNQNYKEVTLLGQTVNSYKYTAEDGTVVDFPKLLSLIAEMVPNMRIRFTSPHPKDMTDETIEVMAKYPNICRFIHLPVQSGSNNVLKAMNRKYTREWFLDRVQTMRRLIPDVAIGTDIFSGFSGETEEGSSAVARPDAWSTLRFGFMFKYSERPGTGAAKRLPDDVPEEVKIRRLNEIIALQSEIAKESNHNDIGKVYEVLVEGFRNARRSKCREELAKQDGGIPREGRHIGEFVKVKIWVLLRPPHCWSHRVSFRFVGFCLKTA